MKILKIFFLCAVLLSANSQAKAASWQWSSQNGVDRVVVRLDENELEKSISRTSQRNISIELDGKLETLTRTGSTPSADSLLQTLTASNNDIVVVLKDPAFGYISRRDGNTITIEVFKDSFGARWKPSDSNIPTPTVDILPVELANPENIQDDENPDNATVPSENTANSQDSLALINAQNEQNTVSAEGELANAPYDNEQANLDIAKQGELAPSQTEAESQSKEPNNVNLADNANALSQNQQAATNNLDNSQIESQAESEEKMDRTQSQTITAPRTSSADLPPTDFTNAGRAPGPSNTVSGENGTAVPSLESQTHTDISAGQANPNDVSQGEDNQVRGQINNVGAGEEFPVVNDVADPNAPSPIELEKITQSIDEFNDRLPKEQTLLNATQVPNLLASENNSTGQVGAKVLESAQPENAQLSAEPAKVPTKKEQEMQAIQNQIEEHEKTMPPVPENNSVDIENNEPAEAQVVTEPADLVEKEAGTTITEPPISSQALQDEPVAQAEQTNLSGAEQPELIEKDGTSLRAKFFKGGPSDWPEDKAFSSSYDLEIPEEDPAVAEPISREQADIYPSESSEQTDALEDSSSPSEADSPSEPEQVTGTIDTVEKANAEAEKARAEEEKAKEQIIYVDEEGNPVPKPADPDALMEKIRLDLKDLQYGKVQSGLENLLKLPLTPDLREEALYMLSEVLFTRFTNRWNEGYEQIVKTTNEAMNSNLRSERIPEALARLGRINLLTGNLQEAAGYFAALRRKYPTDPEVPLVYYELGREQVKKQQYAEAVKNFQVVMEKYPESGAVRLAARYMAESLYRQGHYERAMILIDFVDRRWPRIYIDDPSYLLMVADAQYKRGRLDDALVTYWIYYNLLPTEPTNDQVLLDIGTIYLLQNDKPASRRIFNKLIREYPKSPLAPLAVLRLGEEGIYDGDLPLDDLFHMFARPNLTTVSEVGYNKIIKDYPESLEAQTAEFRQAAWQLWRKNNAAAINQAEKFIAKYPNSQYTLRANEIILRAFEKELALALDEQNYDRILSYYERFPQVRAAYPNLSDEMRIALARAYLNRGEEVKGFDLLDTFFERPEEDPKYGQYVYKLNLSRFLRNGSWDKILELGEKVKDWDLSPADQDQLNYTLAIAHENLGQGQLATPYWEKLYTLDDIPLYQKAYATYFMARDAERRRDLAKSYDLNLEALNLFTKLEEERSERADPARVRESLAALMDITEVANRFAESLEWAHRYGEFVPETSPDYSGLQFRIARLHRKMGDLTRWRVLLEDIVKKEPDSVFGRMAASELRTQEVARDLTRFAPGGI